MSASAAPHDPYAALRIPNYRRYIFSLLALTLALQVQGVVVAWQVYDLTHDPLSLGLIGLAEALPYIGSALFAGHVADRHDRRRLVVASICVLVLCSLALLALTLRPRAATEQVRLMYGVIFVSGFARSFLQPARTALGAELLPRELYANAVTWRSLVWQVAAVAGPALGGLLYGFASATAAYSLDVALITTALLSFALIRHVSPVRERGTESMVESLASGVRFVWRQPVILGALTLDLFSVLFGGAVALLPVFADEILHVGPQGLGVLRASPAVGAVIVSLSLAHRRPFRRAGPTLLFAVALFGVAMIGFGLSRNFYLSVGLLAFSGAVDMVSVVVRSTLLQVFTPEHLLGRVSSVNAIFIGSSNEIGAFESGVAARVFGTAPSVVIGGVLTVAIVAITALKLPQLRRLRAIEAGPAAA
jgi:MFS family permease